MILARLSKAIRTQNWFAVVLEFIVVVAGVLVAFLVTEWRMAAAAGLEETRILERLHADIENVTNDRWDWAADRANNRDLLLSAGRLLYAGEAGELSQAQCNAIAQSHVFNSPSLALPILTELESTGEMDLIRNDGIRRAMSQHFLSEGWSAEIDRAINHDVLNLSARHPQLMQFAFPEDAENWNPLFDGSARCDTAAMREDPHFLNELADNISKSTFFMRAVMDGPNRSFRALHQAVDDELGVSHGEADR